MGKLNWGNLTKDERTRYMYLQMSSRQGYVDDFLPEGYSQCGHCGQPSSWGWCTSCLEEFNILDEKLRSN